MTERVEGEAERRRRQDREQEEKKKTWRKPESGERLEEKWRAGRRETKEKEGSSHDLCRRDLRR